MRMKTSIALAMIITLGITTGVRAEEVKLVSFGLITDTHVCDKKDQASAITVNATARYFTGALTKIDAFAQAMNKTKVSFIAELGDFTDNPADASFDYDKRKVAAGAFVDAA